MTYSKILAALAKRKGYNTWFTIKYSDVEGTVDNYFCNICSSYILKKKFLSSIESTPTIKNHGLEHLKEFNLISFL